MTLAWGVGGLLYSTSWGCASSSGTLSLAWQGLGLALLPFACDPPRKGAFAWLRSRAEQSFDQATGVSSYVFSFAVYLGATTFGWPGILFGPVLVCGGKKLFEVLSKPRITHAIAQALLSAPKLSRQPSRSVTREPSESQRAHGAPPFLSPPVRFDLSKSESVVSRM